MLSSVVAIARFHIALIGASGSLVFSYCLTGEIQWGLMAIVMLDWFIVNLCNKCTDWKEDTINNIKHSQFANVHKNKIYTFLAMILLASFSVHFIYGAPNLIWMRLVGLFLGIVYNFPILPGGRLKKAYFFKNVASSLGFVVTLFGYPLSSFPLSSEVDFWYIIALTGFFVPFELAFEIIYDLRDYEGDRKENVRSFPVVHGIAWAKRLVLILDAVSASIMLLSLATGVLPWKQGVMVFGPITHFALFYCLNRVGIQESAVQLFTWFFVGAQAQYLLWIHLGLPVEASFLFGDLNPIKIVDLAMITIMFFTFFWNVRYFGTWKFILGYLAIAISGGVCENSVILLYHFYHYNQEIWYAYVGVMPLEVTLIWPQVIFCSYRLIRENFRQSGLKLALYGSLEVFGLAYFVEICCVSRGFWWWTKSNLLGVPVIGVIGWAIFAFVAFLALEELSKGGILQTVLLPISSMIVVHVGVVGLWKIGFNYISEYELPLDYAMIFSIVASIGQATFQIMCGLRKRSDVTVIQESPRLLAAAVLLYTLMSGNPPFPVVVITIFLSIPYFSMLKFGWPEFLLEQRRKDLEILKSQQSTSLTQSRTSSKSSSKKKKN